MEDMLIPIGLLLFIGLFVYAFVRGARKQQREKSSVFRKFAQKHGLHFADEDPGVARRFARDFDGIGQFSSPSLGEVLPKDVASGNVNGSAAICFRHSTRFSEGWAREWLVAGVNAHGRVAERCSVQFLRKGAEKTTMVLKDPVVEERSFGRFRIVVRAPAPAAAGRIAGEAVLSRLANLAGDLPFRPEIQIRGNRVLAYPADRNASIEDVETLESLYEFARTAAAVR